MSRLGPGPDLLSTLVRRAARPAGTEPASRRPALLALAGRTGRSVRTKSGAEAELPLRRPPQPPLEYRRPAAPDGGSAAAAAPARATSPPVPVIDIEALSRDVIGRIEKRLRIERERHGRI